MSVGVRYPYASAIARAEELSKRVRAEFCDFFNSKRPPTFDELRQIVEDNRSVLVENEKIPGGQEAVLIDVEGVSYILIDKRFRRRKTNRAFCLGHELGHLLLNHQSTFVGNLVMPYSEKPYDADQALQVLYENERELEANFFSMMLIAPDPYLDEIVDNAIYISAYQLAKRLDIELGSAAARIELYRSMFGYERSYAAAARKNRTIEEDKLVSRELPSKCQGLEVYLPLISPQLVQYIQ